jgi:aerobic carbon-monoxide dehydrogenase medium subunit
MKPAAFDLARPASLAEAASLLASREDARVLAGGQSLGPMLNLRVVAPGLLVSVAHLPELAGAQETADAVTIGAGVTHAAIADGRTPDIGDGILARIAEGIAYRAVRNRGTIGGSLCHADPAADWPCTLTALGAVMLTWSGDGGRDIPIERFIAGPFTTDLRPGEILRAVRIPKPSASARWGYYKACRKPGEFAHAMAAVLDDPGNGRRRIAIGATGTKPLWLYDPARAADALGGSGLDDIAIHMQMVALRHALSLAVA